MPDMDKAVTKLLVANVRFDRNYGCGYAAEPPGGHRASEPPSDFIVDAVAGESASFRQERGESRLFLRRPPTVIAFQD